MGYNSYSNGLARKIDMFIAESDNIINKINTMYEMVSMKYDQRCRDISTKAIMEGAGFDDVEFLYQEADAEAAKDKKNILQKAIEWIREMFQKVVQMVKNIFSKKVDPNKEVEIPKNAEEQVNAAKSWWGSIGEALSKIKRGDFSGIPEIYEKHKALINTATAVTAGVVLVKTGKAKQIADTAGSIAADIDKFLGGAIAKLLGTSNGELDERNAAIRPFQALAEHLKTLIAKITGKFLVVDTTKEKQDAENEDLAKKAAERKEKQGAYDDLFGGSTSFSDILSAKDSKKKTILGLGTIMKDANSKKFIIKREEGGSWEPIDNPVQFFNGLTGKIREAGMKFIKESCSAAEFKYYVTEAVNSIYESANTADSYDDDSEFSFFF